MCIHDKIKIAFSSSASGFESLLKQNVIISDGQTVSSLQGTPSPPFHKFLCIQTRSLQKIIMQDIHDSRPGKSITLETGLCWCSHCDIYIVNNISNIFFFFSFQELVLTRSWEKGTCLPNSLWEPAPLSPDDGNFGPTDKESEGICSKVQSCNDLRSPV